MPHVWGKTIFVVLVAKLMQCSFGKNSRKTAEANRWSTCTRTILKNIYNANANYLKICNFSLKGAVMPQVTLVPCVPIRRIHRAPLCTSINFFKPPFPQNELSKSRIRQNSLLTRPRSAFGENHLLLHLYPISMWGRYGTIVASMQLGRTPSLHHISQLSSPSSHCPHVQRANSHPGYLL